MDPETVRTLWVPRCGACRRPAVDLILVPGEPEAPPKVARLTVAWSCPECKSRNYAPANDWVPLGRAEG